MAESEFFTEYRPKVFEMLVGLPGSGKSTFVKDKRPGWIVASSDSHIEARAAREGKTYSEVFTDAALEANISSRQDAVDAFEKGENVIWDATNLSRATRKARLDLVPDDYMKIAIALATPDRLEWEKRLESRPGKIIPESVMSRMIETFEPPEYSEGFDIIIEIEV